MNVDREQNIYTCLSNQHIQHYSTGIFSLVVLFSQCYNCTFYFRRHDPELSSLSSLSLHSCIRLPLCLLWSRTSRNYSAFLYSYCPVDSMLGYVV